MINDRNTPVTHFSWSHDGRMALICYQDGFVLVGSVAGQRYWSSMLNLESTITCGIWTPDDQQVYFGTTQGQIIVVINDVEGRSHPFTLINNNYWYFSISDEPQRKYDFAGKSVYDCKVRCKLLIKFLHQQVQICSDVGITSMAWSCEKFKMEEGEDTEPGVSNAGTKR